MDSYGDVYSALDEVASVLRYKEAELKTKADSERIGDEYGLCRNGGGHGWVIVY